MMSANLLRISIYIVIYFFNNDFFIRFTVLFGHTKKRPGQPETARVLQTTPVVLEYCLNQIFVEIIMQYDVK
jgi:hypothetical protein